MITNTPSECMGSQPLWRKALIAFGILANPLMLFKDKLGVVAHPLYKTTTGLQLETRGRTTDINDAVVVLSGHEYPVDLLGLQNISKPVVLDCGGHIGTFSLYVKQLYPQSNIIIFEPVAANRALLQKNFALNPQLHTAITIIPKGLYGTPGTFYIDLSNKQFDAVSLQKEKPSHKQYITTEAMTFSQAVQEYAITRVDLMKLDVEGAEYSILKESVDDLSRHVKRIIMEYHPAGDVARRNEIVHNLQAHNWELIYETKNILGFDNRSL